MGPRGVRRRRPTTDQTRERWERRAGPVAAHREVTGHDDRGRRARPGAEARPGRGVRLLARRLAGPRPTGGRPRRAGDVRRPAPGPGPRLRAREGVGAAATSPTSSPAPARPPRRTAAPPHCAAAEADARHRRTTAPGCAPKPTRPPPWPRRSTSSAAELDGVDDARARWLAHTAETRAAADRAAAELPPRRADADARRPEVTAAEWLAVHDAAIARTTSTARSPRPTSFDELVRSPSATSRRGDRRRARRRGTRAGACRRGRGACAVRRRFGRLDREGAACTARDRGTGGRRCGTGGRGRPRRAGDPLARRRPGCGAPGRSPSSNTARSSTRAARRSDPQRVSEGPTGSGGAPLSCHAQRSVATMPAIQPGRRRIVPAADRGQRAAQQRALGVDQLLVGTGARPVAGEQRPAAGRSPADRGSEPLARRGHASGVPVVDAASARRRPPRRRSRARRTRPAAPGGSPPGCGRCRLRHAHADQSATDRRRKRRAAADPLARSPLVR